MLAFLGLWACQISNVDWEEKYKTNPGQVVLDLQQIENPTERLAIVENLQKSFPGQTEELCQVLPSSTREYCIERNKRPHLWMPVKEPVASRSKSTNVVATEGDDGCLDVACRIEMALESARRGRLSAVEKRCASSSIKDEHECLFATAERLVGTGGVQHYNTGVEICRLAQTFSTNCQNHLIQQLAKHAPDADTQSDWEVIFTAHRAIQTTWGWRDPQMQKQFQHRLWSEALGVSYAGADSIVGNPLEVVPAEYHCHVYSAAAWRLFQLEEPSTKTLSRWQEYLESALVNRSNKPEAIDQQRKFRAASNLWSVPENIDGPDVVPYLSTSFRLRSPSVSIEQQLSILEAIARHPPVELTILEVALNHNNRLVQVTASRLLDKQPSED